MKTASGIIRPALMAVLAVSTAWGVSRDASTLIIVVDSSRSMEKEAEDGRTRLDVALDAVIFLTENLPRNTVVGVIVFGHRGKEYGKDDIEVIIPPGPVASGLIAGRLKELMPVGISPLAASLEKAAEQLKGVSGKACILMVTDGRETGGGSPVAMARKIRDELKISVVIDVVGLNVAEAAAGQLRDIAVAGGGKFYRVKDSAEMSVAVMEVARDRVTGFRRPKKGLPRKKTDFTVLSSRRVGRGKSSRGGFLGTLDEEGLGSLVITYAGSAPESVNIYNQKTRDSTSGSHMWIRRKNTFKTSLDAGVYRLKIKMPGKDRLTNIRNIVIRGGRETLVRLD